MTLDSRGYWTVEPLSDDLEPSSTSWSRTPDITSAEGRKLPDTPSAETPRIANVMRRDTFFPATEEGAGPSAEQWGHSAILRRREPWRRVVKLADGARLDDLFDYSVSTTGRVFTLTPETENTDQVDNSRLANPQGAYNASAVVPLQSSFRGCGAIPSSLSNTSCRSLGIDKLLSTFNDVLGTEYTFATPGLRQCLQRYINRGSNFGVAYGMLRPRWLSDGDLRGDFSDVLRQIRQYRQADRAMRRNAIRGDRIVNSRIPPRRVWDLYSNRVLPFWIFPSSTMPRNLWAVSHSCRNRDQWKDMAGPHPQRCHPGTCPRRTAEPWRRVRVAGRALSATGGRPDVYVQHISCGMTLGCAYHRTCLSARSNADGHHVLQRTRQAFPDGRQRRFRRREALVQPCLDHAGGDFGMGTGRTYRIFIRRSGGRIGPEP